MDTRLTVLGHRHSYLNNIVAELRDQEIQQDRLRFRFNLERIGNLMAYEISKELPSQTRTVTTVLGELDMEVIDNQPVLISIMRAGVPLHNGFLQLFDRADNGFVGAYRHTTKGNEFIIKMEYLAAPDLPGKSLILLDPMIATGKSIVLTYQAIVDACGQPDQVFLAGVIGSEEGVEHVLRQIPNAKVYLAALDRELTAKSYIVPGLGDAGDLAFGPK